MIPTTVAVVTGAVCFSLKQAMRIKPSSANSINFF